MFICRNYTTHWGGYHVTLNAVCCPYVQEFMPQNPAFLRRFRLTFCAEEIFFQTLLLNSRFKNDVENNNLRHIVWELRNGNIPAVLDESDLSTLHSSKQLFARRFDYPASEKIMDLLIAGS